MLQLSPIKSVVQNQISLICTYQLPSFVTLHRRNLIARQPPTIIVTHTLIITHSIDISVIQSSVDFVQHKKWGRLVAMETINTQFNIITHINKQDAFTQCVTFYHNDLNITVNL